MDGLILLCKSDRMRTFLWAMVHISMGVFMCCMALHAKNQIQSAFFISMGIIHLLPALRLWQSPKS